MTILVIAAYFTGYIFPMAVRLLLPVGPTFMLLLYVMYQVEPGHVMWVVRATFCLGLCGYDPVCKISGSNPDSAIDYEWSLVLIKVMN